MEKTAVKSAAIGQRCVYCKAEYPLFPPLVSGCPTCKQVGFVAPVEVVFDYDVIGEWIGEYPRHGIHHYSALLPPLVEHISMMEGATPLVAIEEEGRPVVFIKDESRNPTWSHKDRFNICAVSAALEMGAPGIVASSTCNHGASCAAYAARGGLPAIILVTPHPPAVSSFLLAYGQSVIGVPSTAASWDLMGRIVQEWHYHPVSNFTRPPTNHPFGAEGYKTIAYELYLQLGKRPPSAVFVPVGYGELAFGINKGFQELHQLGCILSVPRIISCEPGSSGAPLKHALGSGKIITEVHGTDSDAYAVAIDINSVRGVVALQESGGEALALTEDEIKNAQLALGRNGIWTEMSSAIAFAGTFKSAELRLSESDLIVCINTSSGFKDKFVGDQSIPKIDGTWQSFIDQIQPQ